MRFVPFLGSDAPRDLPLKFRPRSVRVADSALKLAATEPKLRGNTIECVRDACVETFRIDPHGIEQAFRFVPCPAPDGIRIDLEVRSEVRGETREDGVQFVQEFGGVHQDHAVAIDAKGHRLDLETSIDGDGIPVELPELFVANAEPPVVVDPLVGTLSSIRSTQIMRSVDLSYDHSLDAQVMVWERVYSATDSEVYAVPLDQALARIGSILIVDVSIESWRHCRVANLGFFDRFVVFASRNATGQDPYVAGKLMQGGPAWSVGAAFDIDSPATKFAVGARLDPVVAGEDTGDSPSTAAVRAMTVALQPSGRTTSFVVHDTDIIANSMSNETTEAIACGRDGVDTARFAVAWSLSSSTPTFTVQRRAYDAMAALGGYTSRATGCGGLAIQPSGVPAIGHAIAMDLPASNGLAGFLVGVPIQIALGACPGCTLGADGALFQGGSLSLTVPCLASLVGGTVAFRGFDTASPSGLGLVRLSDTIDMRAR